MKANKSQGRIPQAELSKIIAQGWRAEPPALKKIYELEAESRKLLHDAQYPGELISMFSACGTVPDAYFTGRLQVSTPQASREN